MLTYSPSAATYALLACLLLGVPFFLLQSSSDKSAGQHATRTPFAAHLTQDQLLPEAYPGKEGRRYLLFSTEIDKQGEFRNNVPGSKSGLAADRVVKRGL